MSRLLVPACLAGLLMLAGCDMLGIESASQVAGRREAEGKAIGAACRQAGRAIEDCYVLNRKAEKAAIFTGWREMNDYMRENQLETVTPQLTQPTTEVAAKAAPEPEAPPAKKAAKGEGKAEKGEKSDKPEKADKADKSDKGEPPDKPEKKTAAS